MEGDAGLMTGGVWLACLMVGASCGLFGLWFLSYRDARLLDFGSGRAASSAAGRTRAARTTDESLAACSAVLWLMLRGRMPGWASSVAAAIPAFLIFRLLWRARVATRRQEEMKRHWPLLLESMSVAALSGLNLNTAFELAAKRIGGSLRTEAEKVVLRMGGGMPLSGALETLVRERVPGAERLASVLLQCEVLGTPVAGVLESLALEASNLEKQDMEARFNSLPLKLSLITVTFLLPPVLILSIAPHVLVFLNTKW